MANLNSMPVEIIDKICLEFHKSCKFQHTPSYLNEAKKALAGLCRTSVRLNQIALPHLYLDINIDVTDTSLIPLTRSLLNNDHLADLVREMSIARFAGFERDPVLEGHFASQPPDFLAGKTVEMNGRVTGSDEWYTIRVLEYFLSRFRKIEYLCLDICDKLDLNDCFRYIRDKHLDNTDFLRSLREVVICNNDEKWYPSFKFGSITAMLSVTPFQKMKLFQPVEIRELDGFPLPSLLELRLEETHLTNDEIIRLVRSCPNLQLLCYENEITYLDSYTITSESLSLAIRHLKRRLQTLSLNFVDFYIDKGSMDSFVEFSKLQSLRIETYALADRIEERRDPRDEDDEDYDDHTIALQPWLYKLPKSLKYLSICRSSKMLNSELLNLADRAADDFPNLRTLVVDWPLGLRELFRGTNIEYIEPPESRRSKYKKITMDE